MDVCTGEGAVWSEGKEIERDGNPDAAEGGFPRGTRKQGWLARVSNREEDNAQVSDFY